MIDAILERSIEETVKKKERTHIQFADTLDSKDQRIDSFTLESQSTIEYEKKQTQSAQVHKHKGRIRKGRASTSRTRRVIREGYSSVTKLDKKKVAFTS